jgi:phage-related protein
MNVIDTLFLALGVDAKGIDKGLNEARAKIQAGAQGLANSLMAPFKSALGALAAGLSLGAVTNQYLQQADAIGKMADSIGVDMEELQAWGEAAARAGGSAQGFQQSLQSMNRMLQMTATTGKGPAAIALEQFGIKATDASGKARDSFEILRDLAGAMEGMDKQKAIGFGQRLGLDRGTIMLLQSGKVAVDDLIRRQKELGVYTKEDAEITAKANDAIADLGQSMKAAAAIFMRAIVPAITWVTEHLTALVQDFRKHKTFYLTALGAIAAFLTAKMIPTLVKVGLLNARIWAPYAVVAGIIAGLALIFDDLWTYMNGGKSALEDYWKTLGTGPELLEKFNQAWQAVKEKGGAVLEGLKNIAKGVFDFFLSHIDSFTLMFDGVWDMLDGLFNFDFKKIGKGLGEAFTGAMTLIDGVFESIFSGMEKMSVWDAVKNGAVAVWGAIKKIAIGFFEGLPKEAQDKLVRLWTDIKAAFHWDELKEAFAAIWNIDWEKIKNAVIDTFDKAIAAIKKMFSDWIDGLIAQIKGIINMIPGVDTVKNAAGAVGDAVSGAWGTVKGWFGGNDAAAAATPSPKDAVSAQAAAAANVTETTNNTTNNDSHNTYNITVNNQPNAEQFATDLESFGRRGPGLGRMAASGQTN